MLLCAKFGEGASNISSDIQPYFTCRRLKMTSVTSKIRSRSHGSNLVFVLPSMMLLCAKFGEDNQIFLQIFSRNHLSRAVALNDLRDLENNVRVTRFKFCLCLALALLCTKFGEDT